VLKAVEFRGDDSGVHLWFDPDIAFRGAHHEGGPAKPRSAAVLVLSAARIYCCPNVNDPEEKPGARSPFEMT
jgi:hypothetical protein